MHKLLFSFLMLSLTFSCHALNLELTQGVYSAQPIAITAEGLSSQTDELVSVITEDLKRSGQFRILHEKQAVTDSSVAYWQQRGADSLLSMRVVLTADNQYNIMTQLIDVQNKKHTLLLNKRLSAPVPDVRLLAHRISDLVYEKLTGHNGVFSTKIAYVLVTTNKAKQRISSLMVADADGHNPEKLLVSTEPIMSPSWSPDGKKIAYVSFENRRAQTFIVDIASGKRKLITRFSGINGAPAWSPDGRYLAVVLSKETNPKIYQVDLSNGRMRQMTFGNSIDTEPNYAPDGKSLIFTSDRGGSPQIYALDFKTGKVGRMTYLGGYNARASYLPSGKQVVLLHRGKNGFIIGNLDVERGNFLPLTSGGLDESPSVAPNGQMVLYATKDGINGLLAMVSIDGRVQLKLPTPDGNIQEPSWSPFLNRVS